VAANRYDNSRSAITALAQQVIGVCAVEFTKARLAFGLSLNDPEIELTEFKQAVEIVEKARKSRIGGQ
jgi:hypothetical protein